MKAGGKFGEKGRINKPFFMLFYKGRNNSPEHDFNIQRDHLCGDICARENGIKTRMDSVIRQTCLKKVNFYINSELPIDGGYNE